MLDLSSFMRLSSVASDLDSVTVCPIRSPVFVDASKRRLKIISSSVDKVFMTFEAFGDNGEFAPDQVGQKVSAAFV